MDACNYSMNSPNSTTSPSVSTTTFSTLVCVYSSLVISKQLPNLSSSSSSSRALSSQIPIPLRNSCHFLTSRPSFLTILQCHRMEKQPLLRSEWICKSRISTELPEWVSQQKEAEAMIDSALQDFAWFIILFIRYGDRSYQNSRISRTSWNPCKGCWVLSWAERLTLWPSRLFELKLPRRAQIIRSTSEKAASWFSQ